ncbi:MAG: 3'-5' exonuclease [Bacteroidia bacterium]|nr:3'-5' exonuclease [Bacteroidia bacterium]
MSLVLTRPLVIFDLETTGINTSYDRIVELYLIKVNPDGSKETVEQRLNPGRPIPPESSAIHGIYDHHVANEPTFKDKAVEYNNFLKNCDFAGFNSNKFDFPMLVEEFYRADIDFETDSRKFVDAQRIFHLMEPRNLSAAYKYYCEKDLENAHSAKADTEATWEIIQSQLVKYNNLESNVDFLHNFCGQSNLVDLAGRIVYNEKKQPVFNFGKHKGKPVTEVMKSEPSYYDWMMKGDFPLQTKKVLTKLKLNQLNTNGF